MIGRSKKRRLVGNDIDEEMKQAEDEKIKELEDDKDRLAQQIVEMDKVLKSMQGQAKLPETT